MTSGVTVSVDQNDRFMVNRLLILCDQHVTAMDE